MDADGAGDAGRGSPDLLPPSPTPPASPPPSPQHSLDDSDTNDSEEPPAKLRRVSSPGGEKAGGEEVGGEEAGGEEADGETCPICLDAWAGSGEHRLVALRCGHLFGSSCLTRWLRARPARDRTCPTCKARAQLKDVRCIYARRLVAVDHSQITSLQKQIDTLIAEKSRAELELQKSQIAHRACSMQLEGLRSLMKSQAGREPPAPPRRLWRFALDKNLELSREGGCRVLAYNVRTCELYASQRSATPLFPGYGVRAVRCGGGDYAAGAFVALHPKPIRDLTYSQPRDLLLSAALDGAACVVERGVAGLRVRAGVPLWSCAWDRLRGHELYLGGVGGALLHYDVRRADRALRRLATPDLSPVLALRSTEHGLLACQLNSCALWAPDAASGEWRATPLPAEGPLMSLCYDEEGHRAVVCSRPGEAPARLTVCRLRGAGAGAAAVEVEARFAGSARAAVLSRACVVRVPGACWVAAHAESAAATVLHALDGGRSASLASAAPALDLCALEAGGAHVLAALSDTRLRLYRATAAAT